jgi:hypothetical protein
MSISESEALRMLGRPKRTQSEQCVRDLRELGRRAERRDNSCSGFARAVMTAALVRRAISGEPVLYERQTVTRSLNDRTPHEWLPHSLGGKTQRGFGIYNVHGDLLQTVATEREAAEIIRRARKGLPR